MFVRVPSSLSFFSRDRSKIASLIRRACFRISIIRLLFNLIVIVDFWIERKRERERGFWMWTGKWKRKGQDLGQGYPVSAREGEGKKNGGNIIYYIRFEKIDSWFFDRSITSKHACVPYSICRRGIARISRETWKDGWKGIERRSLNIVSWPAFLRMPRILYDTYREYSTPVVRELEQVTFQGIDTIPIRNTCTIYISRFESNRIEIWITSRETALEGS